METKHTPGPWVAIEKYPESEFPEHKGHGFEVRAGDGAITGWGSVTQTKANAHLIAAAPDLLEMLKALDEEFGRWRANGTRYCATQTTVETLRNEVRAAIAKAEGR